MLMERPGGNTGTRFFLAILAALALVLIVARAMTRFLDLDEHQFVAPPMLLLQEGLQPYADYPYFHVPNLIYLYAAAMSVADHKLLVARLISSIAGWLTVVLLFRTGWNLFAHFPSRTRWLYAGGIAAVYLCSRLFTYTNGWSWNHDTAVLSAVSAFLLHVRGLRRDERWPIVLAGALVGMAVGIRLSFALIFVPFAASLILGRSTMSQARRWSALAAAAAAGLLSSSPTLYWLMRAPDRFCFGNFEYVQLNTAYYETMHADAMTLIGKIGYGFCVFFGDPGNLAILTLALYMLGWRIWRTEAWKGKYANELGLLLGLMPALLAGCWGPTPTQYQYYYMMLPFLALAALYALASDPAIGSEPRRVRRAWIGVLLLVMLTGLPRWYWKVVYLVRPDCWTPLVAHRTGEWIRASVPAGTRVLAIDPIQPLEAGLPVYPEFAVGRFPLHVGRFMSPARRDRERIVWDETLERLLRDRPPEAIFIARRLVELAPELVSYAEANGFRRLEAPDGDHLLWVRDRRPEVEGFAHSTHRPPE